MDISLMIEGQNGLNWPRWKAIIEIAEQAGFAGVYRSDHYTNASPPDKDSLELWVSLTYLANHSQRLHFGPLVSPVSFRHPTMTARMAAAVDDLSGGRLTLGLGAGWQEREHHNYGLDLLPIPERFRRFEEALQVIHNLLHSEVPVNFTGHYYRLHEAILLPRPQRPGGPPILVGGNGEKRTLPLAARYADEWNAVYIPVDEFQRLNRRLDDLLRTAGRQPHEVRRSLMTGLVFGKNPSQVQEAVQRRTQGRFNADQLRARGLLVGTPAELRAQLQTLAAAGVQNVMIQWLDLDNLDGLHTLAEAVL